MDSYVSSPPVPIRVFIADDQFHVIKGLQALLELETDLEVVGTASSGVDALNSVRTLEPDVILIDRFMPHLDGIEVIQRVRQDDIQSTIIFMVTVADSQVLSEAKSAGADAVFEKGATDTELCTIIRDKFGKTRRKTD